MESVHLNQHSDIEKMLTGLEKVRAMICCNNYGIVGNTYYLPKQRFLDMLNKDLLVGEQHITNFLVVSQAVLVNPVGEREQIPSPCFVSKDSIMFIGTYDETRSTTSENVNSVRAYPWTKKDELLVKIVFSLRYRLIGQIHNDPLTLPVRSVESRHTFLPMTNVKVISSLEPRETHFNFVAVNKDHIFLFEVLAHEA